MDNVTAELYRPQPFLSTVNGAWNAFLSSRNGLCQVDSLTAPPANATQREATRSRALRGKDQTADGTRPSISTVCTASLRKSAEPAYWPRRVPALGQRCTRAGERSAGLFVCVTRTTRTCPNIRDLILKCTKTHESAQLGLGTQICVIILAIYWGSGRTRTTGRES